MPENAALVSRLAQMQKSATKPRSPMGGNNSMWYIYMLRRRHGKAMTSKKGERCSGMPLLRNSCMKCRLDMQQYMQSVDSTKTDHMQQASQDTDLYEATIGLEGRRAADSLCKRLGNLNMFEVGNIHVLRKLYDKITSNDPVNESVAATKAQLKKFCDLSHGDRTASNRGVLQFISELHEIAREKNGFKKALPKLSAFQVYGSPLLFSSFEQKTQNSDTIKSYLHWNVGGVMIEQLFYGKASKALGKNVSEFNARNGGGFDSESIFNNVQQGLKKMYQATLALIDPSARKEDIVERADRLFKFEARLAGCLPSAMDRRAGMSEIREFASCESAPWQEYLTAYLSNFKVKGTNFQVCIPTKTKEVVEFLWTQFQQEANQQLLLDYITTRIVSHYAPLAMTASFKNINSDFFDKIMLGRQSPKPAWMITANFIRNNMPEQSYVVFKHCSPAEKDENDHCKQQLQDLMRDLKRAACEHVARKFSQDAKTSTRIQQYITNDLQTVIGIPETITAGVFKDADTVFELMQNNAASQQQKMIDRLFEPLSLKDMKSPMNLLMCNACFVPSLDSVVFTQAMCEFPFSTKQALQGESLQPLKQIVCHELSHIFDDMGLNHLQVRCADPTIAKNMQATMLEWGGCFWNFSHNIDPHLKVGECLADKDGFKIAWIDYMTRNGCEFKGLDHEASARRFPQQYSVFCSLYIRQWNASINDVSKLRLLISDPHPMPNARVAMTVHPDPRDVLKERMSTPPQSMPIYAPISAQKLWTLQPMQRNYAPVFIPNYAADSWYRPTSWHQVQKARDT